MLSIIIPTLNEEKFIGTTLKSLKNQPYQDVEVIVVDGESQDSTVDIAEKYDAKVIIFNRPKTTKSTVAEQRNLGAKNARGEILVFFDADTHIPSNCLSKIVKKFERDPDLVALSAVSRPIEAPLCLKFEYILYDLLRMVLLKLPGSFKKFLSNAYGLAIRKNEFNKVGGFNEKLERNTDGELGKRLCKKRLGKLGIFSDIFVDGGNVRRFKALGLRKFNIYYMYILGNIMNNLSKARFWNRLLTIFSRYDSEYHQVRFSN